MRLIASSMRNKARGFTLIELLVVLTIVALLASLAAPVVHTAVRRANEAALRETLQVTRSALDDFYADHQRYPYSLDELVEKRYLRSLPIDPIVGSGNGWELEDADEQEGIIDLQSSSSESALDGSNYSDW